MKSKDKPYILYVAEKIYLEVSEIKKKNNGFSNIDACLLYTSPSPRDFG